MLPQCSGGCDGRLMYSSYLERKGCSMWAAGVFECSVCGEKGKGERWSCKKCSIDECFKCRLPSGVQKRKKPEDKKQSPQQQQSDTKSLSEELSTYKRILAEKDLELHHHRALWSMSQSPGSLSDATSSPYSSLFNLQFMQNIISQAALRTPLPGGNPVSPDNVGQEVGSAVRNSQLTPPVDGMKNQKGLVRALHDDLENSSPAATNNLPIPVTEEKAHQTRNVLNQPVNERRSLCDGNSQPEHMSSAAINDTNGSSQQPSNDIDVDTNQDSKRWTPADGSTAVDDGQLLSSRGQLETPASPNLEDNPPIPASVEPDSIPVSVTESGTSNLAPVTEADPLVPVAKPDPSFTATERDSEVPVSAPDPEPLVAVPSEESDPQVPVTVTESDSSKPVETPIATQPGSQVPVPVPVPVTEVPAADPSSTVTECDSGLPVPVTDSDPPVAATVAEHDSSKPVPTTKPDPSISVESNLPSAATEPDSPDSSHRGRQSSTGCNSEVDVISKATEEVEEESEEGGDSIPTQNDEQQTDIIKQQILGVASDESEDRSKIIRDSLCDQLETLEDEQRSITTIQQQEEVNRLLPEMEKETKVDERSEGYESDHHNDRDSECDQSEVQTDGGSYSEDFNETTTDVSQVEVEEEEEEEEEEENVEPEQSTRPEGSAILQPMDDSSSDSFSELLGRSSKHNIRNPEQLAHPEVPPDDAMSDMDGFSDISDEPQATGRMTKEEDDLLYNETRQRDAMIRTEGTEWRVIQTEVMQYEDTINDALLSATQDSSKRLLGYKTDCMDDEYRQRKDISTQEEIDRQSMLSSFSLEGSAIEDEAEQQQLRLKADWVCFEGVPRSQSPPVPEESFEDILRQRTAGLTADYSGIRRKTTMTSHTGEGDDDIEYSSGTADDMDDDEDDYDDDGDDDEDSDE
eukprot:TRINITY_DN12731_c6_g1_i1.p1 TRINITY_DN12731_c6_g1~~TRINITY_DN12731_c6_g1_i1.p1  ORF type:complete len:917 (+),score=251.67 TRINITY_DN12731_c6_g1_i1:1173-3923(+)